MKQFSKTILFVLFSIVLFSCSSDSGSSGSATTFKVNNETYTMQPTNSIILLNQDLTSQNMLRSNFTVTGLIGTSKIATVSFDLFRKPSESISGTYTIYDVENINSDDIESYVQTNNRACLGWTSSLQILQISSGSSNTANNPTTTASITITDNGSNSYTIKYTGNYRQYDGDFNVSGNIPVEMEVTGTAVVN
jgi:hypothetical protein